MRARMLCLVSHGSDSRMRRLAHAGGWRVPACSLSDDVEQRDMLTTVDVRNDTRDACHRPSSQCPSSCRGAVAGSLLFNGLAAAGRGEFLKTAAVRLRCCHFYG